MNSQDMKDMDMGKPAQDESSKAMHHKTSDVVPVARERQDNLMQQISKNVGAHEGCEHGAVSTSMQGWPAPPPCCVAGWPF